MSLNSKSCEIQDELFPGAYDDSNALVLPGSRSKLSQTPGKKPKGTKSKQRTLTKNQRRKLEKIVKRRNDKKNRAELLDELQQYKLSEQIYKSLSPLVLAQQVQKNELKSKKKLKRFQNSIQNSQDTPINASSGNPDTQQPLTSEDESVSTKYNVKTRNFIIMPQEKQEEDSLSCKQIAKIGKNSIPGDQFLVTSKSSISIKSRQETEKEDVHTTIVIKDSVKLTTVFTNRTSAVELSRSKLPIIGEEQIIMEAIRENLVVVLAGETGSGKTTQVPQFLFEAGYASNGKIIGVTEPRRIAAIAMSQRVSHELNVPKHTVAYQIRFEGNTSSKTKVKFMTDGVLLKEMENDFLLTNYSVICIDEAHERSLYTDILIGLLSRTIHIRQKKGDPLRVVIMSATMRVEDFTNNAILFPRSPLFIHIPTRQFPVHIHFNRVTPDNYLDAAKKKVAQIHNTLPEGGILVFLTGQDEVKKLVKILNKMFTSADNIQGPPTRKRQKVSSEITDFDLNKIPALPSEDFVNKNESDSEEDTVEAEDVKCKEPLLAIPLYSMLSIKEQEKVFAPPPKNARVCIVATNVAETSLTIPGIRYVVDCGKVKLKLWDKLTGIQKYEVTWCSKASSHQRAGRAGRTGPGHCYRLYSSAVFQSDFSEYSVPEISVRPVDDMVLLMKSMSINQVRSFPYPTHPGNEQLVAAERLLILLGALEIPPGLKTSSQVDKSRITPLGKTMAYLPVSPRFSKMLAVSFPHSIVEYVITLVAALSVQDVLLDTTADTESNETRLKWQNVRRKWGGKGSSLLLGDCMVLLRAVGAFEFEGGTCESATRLGLRYKSMIEIRKLRKNLTSHINLVVSSQETLLNPQMKPPTPEQAELLRQVILSGCPDRIAKLITTEEVTGDSKKWKHAYRCGDLEEPAFIYESSVLRGSYPEWIVYQESFEFNGKIFLKGITAVESEWIPIVCPILKK